MVAVPAVGDLAAAVRRNAEREWGQPFGDWRRQARPDLLERASQYTARLGAVRTIPDGPWLVTGHQPDLYHGGVWIKNFLVDEICQSNRLVGLNVIVDSDLASRRLLMPGFDGRFKRVAVALPAIRAGWPWESQPPLDAGGWQALLNAAAQPLQTLPPASKVRATFEEFRHVVGRCAVGGNSLADSLAAARHMWESQCGPLHYLELPVSHLSVSPTFFAFVASVLARLGEFWEAYNGSLHDYRKQRGIRTIANPVPDLRRRDDLWETPFWCRHPNGERGGLFVLGQEGNWLLQSKNSDFIRLQGNPSDWAEQLQAAFCGDFQLRPRALTLTMFLRLAVADVFVHGIGGSKYDRVTDACIRRFFAVEPPPYAVASATVCADIDGRPLSSEDPKSLRRLLRDMQWNPQRFADVPALESRKEALLTELRRAQGKRQAPLAEQVRSLNQQYASHLTEQRADVERRLRDAMQGQSEREALTWREYPYFLFAPTQLRSLLQQ